MSLIEAIILGIIQGLTEFLPVSSSGHIELGKALFGIQLEEGLLFTVLLHFATALSTIVVFRSEIIEIFKGLFQFKWNEETRYSLLIILSMIPATAVGLFFMDRIDAFFESNVVLVCSMLILTGFVLYISDRVKGTEGSMGYQSAIVIGMAQAIAILPGISRSGATIGTALLLGISRERAAKFSFLMVLPLIFGGMASEVKDFMATPNMTDMAGGLNWTLGIAGFLAAFIAGYFACKWMIELVKRSHLTYFAYYCWIVGVLGLVLMLV